MYRWNGLLGHKRGEDVSSTRANIKLPAHRGAPGLTTLPSGVTLRTVIAHTPDFCPACATHYTDLFPSQYTRTRPHCRTISPGVRATTRYATHVAVINELANIATIWFDVPKRG